MLFWGIVIFSLFVLFIFVKILLLKPAPTCEDKIQNQGETEVDCGGPCEPCQKIEIKPVAVEKVSVFNTKDKNLSILAEVSNLNPDRGAKITYTLELLNGGKVFKTIKGSEFVYPLENRFINQIVPRASNPANKVVMTIDSTEWETGQTKLSLKPVLNYKIATSSISQKFITISGKIENASIISNFDVKIIAVLKNKRGFNIFAANTLISDLDSLETRPFRISIPASKDLVDSVDLSKTVIYPIPYNG